MVDVSELIGRVDWKPHVVKDGSREHVFVFGLLEDGGRSTVVEWCSEPFCDHNRYMAQRLLDEGFDLVAAQPPPKLRQLIEDSALLHALDNQNVAGR